MSAPAVEVKTTTETTTNNPEALMDAPAASGAQFQNVDIEANNAAPAPAPAKAPAPVSAPAMVDLAASMDYGLINMLLAFAAIIVMISASTVCGGGVTIPGVGTLNGVSCTQIPGYQVAVSTISAFIAIVTALAHSAGALKDERVMEGIALFQFLWWVAGMIVLTFFGSFVTVLYGNGYFGTWAALLFATMALVNTSMMFKRAVNRAAKSTRSPLLFLIVSSAVVMGAAIGPCSPVGNCVSYNAFALSLGTISLGLAIIVLLAATVMPNPVLKAFAGFFVLWWAVGACVVTFGGPFVVPANGYFASLAGVYFSIEFYRGVVAAEE